MGLFSNAIQSLYDTSLNIVDRGAIISKKIRKYQRKSLMDIFCEIDKNRVRYRIYKKRKILEKVKILVGGLLDSITTIIRTALQIAAEQFSSVTYKVLSCA